MSKPDDSIPLADPGDAERRALSVIDRLVEHGHRAVFAGGCVRDWLRGETPSDFDVATDAGADQVQRLFERTVPVGARFGVVLVVVDGEPIEVATFRADAEYVDGRHPVSVRPADPEEDARRRDFTINGMFLDPRRNEVLDYVGGRADIEARIIRAIGDPRERFAEDRLRMLRAVRLAARLGYTIEPATLAAIRAMADGINDIALERIGDEIVRILTEGAARRGFELLQESGLLERILPEIAALQGVEQSPDFHPEGDVFRHTMLLLEQLRQPSETLALGALLHDVGKPRCAGRQGERITFYGHAELGEEMAVAICQRLRRSREVWERVGYLVRNHLRLVDAPRMRRSTLRRFLAEEGIDELLDLARLDALASHENLAAYEFCRAKKEELGSEPLRPPPLLRGADLLELGYPRGPLYGQILHEAETRQLDGEITSREEAIEWLRRTYPLRGERSDEQ
jgi:poly(A) polymerase